MMETLAPTALGLNRAAGRFGTHYAIGGDGPWLVLIHGVGLDLHMWSRQVAALEKIRRVLRYDLIGHGETPPAGGPLSLADFVSQLYELLNLLGVERAEVAGFSLGAMVAQAFALERPAMLEKLALINGVYARSDEARADVLARLRQVETAGLESAIEASLSRWFTEGFRSNHPGEIEKIENRLRANAREGFLPAYRLFADADAELAGRLAAIRAPTLVVTGEHDSGSTPEMARHMREEIPGAMLRVIPGVRHLLPVEASDALNVLLVEFLSGEVGST